MVGLNTKTIVCWITSEEMIRKSAKGAHAKIRHSAKYPAMEEKHVTEYQEMQKKGIKVKVQWFKLRSKKPLNALSPGENFQFFAGWFIAFKS